MACACAPRAHIFTTKTTINRYARWSDAGGAAPRFQALSHAGPSDGYVGSGQPWGGASRDQSLALPTVLAAGGGGGGGGGHAAQAAEALASGSASGGGASDWLLAHRRAEANANAAVALGAAAASAGGTAGGAGGATSGSAPLQPFETPGHGDGGGGEALPAFLLPLLRILPPAAPGQRPDVDQILRILLDAPSLGGGGGGGGVVALPPPGMSLDPPPGMAPPPGMQQDGGGEYGGDDDRLGGAGGSNVFRQRQKARLG